MAFEQGDRVTTFFTGDGTVIDGGIITDDGDKYQLVEFDNPLIGRRLWLIRKLRALDVAQT